MSLSLWRAHAGTAFLLLDVVLLSEHRCLPTVLVRVFEGAAVVTAVQPRRLGHEKAPERLHVEKALGLRQG